MRILLLTLMIISINLSYSQESWNKTSNGSLTYSYPENWIKSEYLETSSNISYGALFFDLGETVELSIIEVPNDTGIIDAHTISNEDIKNLVLNIFSPKTQFINIKDSSIADIDSKFVNAYAITSQNLKVETKLHLIFANNKMIIIQVNSTSEKGNHYLEISNKIFERIKLL